MMASRNSRSSEDIQPARSKTSTRTNLQNITRLVHGSAAFGEKVYRLSRFAAAKEFEV
jgi:hypothetical protein